ncbi:hypothetical protein Cs7R123_47730 [Catellatospora sp. TT07R-123]|uniref:tetratricopeptide repeat protein n=1 Tax=Catellatospora sp. TT07R-123 TaxID=2733863 RepID=UPI001B244C02|nr:tetratricopeptide repeat protein [Catellatospora sp. TT07R-123]GHJ47431.1 hypothetical protein Cs7R123_47730 [Catellatospora sp. TT07R-123]
MTNQQDTCQAYFHRYTTGQARLDDLLPAIADTDGYGRTVTITLLLAVDAVDAVSGGLARPAITLAALLDPAGHPDEFWATAVVAGNLTTHRATGTDTPVDTGQIRQVLLLLDRYSILTYSATASPRAVTIHAVTARAARETATRDQLISAAHTAAAALLTIWPDNDHNTTLAALGESLRTNTTTLDSITQDLLWTTGAPALLYRAGISLLSAGLPTAAVAYWHALTHKARRILGSDHHFTLTAWANLATSYWQAGPGDAVTIEERIAAERERLLGPEHPDTLTAWANLAASYRQAGRTGDAVTILERVTADSERLLGPEHQFTLTVWGNLATSYRQAGRTGDAVTILERVTADSERLLGPEHQFTLTVWGNLATSYRQAGRTGDAVTILERVTAERERLLGPEHPDTLALAARLRQWRSL